MINLLSDVSDFEGDCWRYPASAELWLEDGRARIVRAMPEQERILLRHLMDAGGWVSLEELAGALFGHREDGGTECERNSVNVILSRLRGHLKPGLFLECRYGHGWRLVMDWETFEDVALRAVQSVIAA